MNIINCDTCGKFHEGQEIGTYWICEDCNHPPEQKSTEFEQSE